LRNLEDLSDYDCQSLLRKILQNAQIDSIIDGKIVIEGGSKFFPKINELVQSLPEPFLPYEQHITQPLLI
jgi:hypothetical protein